MQLVLESLSSLNQLDPEPGFASQLLTFSERLRVPDGCPDAIEWVRRSLLPRASAFPRVSLAP
ncbi:MAG: hypothetical protein SFW67_22280 [Myxococcaceae bacterium]|nr:hypothetical protein [Myxococcaceae bacterium]